MALHSHKPDAVSLLQSSAVKCCRWPPAVAQNGVGNGAQADIPPSHEVSARKLVLW